MRSKVLTIWLVMVFCFCIGPAIAPKAPRKKTFRGAAKAAAAAASFGRGVAPGQPGTQRFRSGSYTIISRAGRNVVSEARMEITRATINTGSETNTSTRRYARSLGVATDDAGHIFARQLGGSGRDPINIFPQNPRLNQYQFRMFEGRIKDAVLKGGAGAKADAHIVLTYGDPGHPTRPSKITYVVTFRGAPAGVPSRMEFQTENPL